MSYKWRCLKKQHPIWVSSLKAPFVEDAVLTPVGMFDILSKIKCLYMCGNVLGHHLYYLDQPLFLMPIQYMLFITRALHFSFIVGWYRLHFFWIVYALMNIYIYIYNMNLKVYIWIWKFFNFSFLWRIPLDFDEDQIELLDYFY